MRFFSLVFGHTCTADFNRMTLRLPPRFSYHVVILYYILLPILLMIYNVLMFLANTIVGLQTI